MEAEEALRAEVGESIEAAEASAKAMAAEAAAEAATETVAEATEAAGLADASASDCESDYSIVTDTANDSDDLTDSKDEELLALDAYLIALADDCTHSVLAHNEGIDARAVSIGTALDLRGGGCTEEEVM